MTKRRKIRFMISSRLLTPFALTWALMLGSVVFGQPVDTVYHNGSILTMTGKEPTYVEGLKAMTEWVAEQYGELDSKGTLEAGKRADLVILDKDPLKVNPMDIKDIKVVETIRDGFTIYPAPHDEVRTRPSLYFWRV